MISDQLGIVVHSCPNFLLDAPDSVFPNNWFSTHSIAETESREATLILYPMKHESRRRERNPETIARITQHYRKVIDFTFLEQSNSTEDAYLEGTGSLVLDRLNRIAYFVESQRSNPKCVEQWCSTLRYEFVALGKAHDRNQQPVYHTNVMMGIGTEIAVVCAEAIISDASREELLSRLRSTGHDLILISIEQMHHFCGNVIELDSPKLGRVFVMSDDAYRSFSKSQLEVFERKHVPVFHCDLSTIEKYGGGGVRCCIAELF